MAQDQSARSFLPAGVVSSCCQPCRAARPSPTVGAIMAGFGARYSKSSRECPMTRRILQWLAAGILVAGPASAEGVDLLYTLKSATVLPSTDTGWDYIKMQPGTGRLFMARD